MLYLLQLKANYKLFHLVNVQVISERWTKSRDPSFKDISLTCNHNPDSLRLLELFDADGHVSRFSDVEHPELVLFECPDHIIERLALPRYRVAALEEGYFESVNSSLCLNYVY